jgi:hypothetical protein
MVNAVTIIRSLGGASCVARALNVHRSRVSRWLCPEELGGNGGKIPARHFTALLRLAKEMQVPLTAEQLALLHVDDVTLQAADEMHPPQRPDKRFDMPEDAEAA